MLLYQSIGPNPRVVSMYIAEAGMTVPRRFMDIVASENRTPEMLAKNPTGGSPFLELDDGSVLSESIAICQYLGEKQGETALVGHAAEDRARTRSKLRQIDQAVVVPMTNGFRSVEGLAMFESRMLCVPDAAPGNKVYAADGLRQIDRQLGDSEWLCGALFGLADILLFCFTDFGAMVGQPIPENCTALKQWHARVAERPSVAISANPQNGIG